MPAPWRLSDQFPRATTSILMGEQPALARLARAEEPLASFRRPRSANTRTPSLVKTPSKPKPKTPAGGTVTVKVINWRNADLVELQAAESGSANWKKVLGVLESLELTRFGGHP